MSADDIPFEAGNWRVVRNCCIHGSCVGCSRMPERLRPIRALHVQDCSQRYAEQVAAQFPHHKAVAEIQPVYGPRDPQPDGDPASVIGQSVLVYEEQEDGTSVHYIVAPCVRCRVPFSFNPDRVPSSRALTGLREPICQACFDALNETRKKMGLEPWVCPEGAYSKTSRHPL